MILILSSGLLFDIFLMDYEVVVRADFPEGCLEMLRVSDVAQEVGDPLARSEKKWDQGCFTS